MVSSHLGCFQAFPVLPLSESVLLTNHLWLHSSKPPFATMQRLNVAAEQILPALGTQQDIKTVTKIGGAELRCRTVQPKQPTKSEGTRQPKEFPPNHPLEQFFIRSEMASVTALNGVQQFVKLSVKRKS